ncbi:MAG: outer membrane lipoprotein-sorting protein [Armatimonadetes bacterium]|nr:outer membrane lipoprotein-sorting protein [Armatimonadota bacterium]
MRRCAVVVGVLCLTCPLAAETIEQIVARNKHMLDGINDFTCVMTFSVRSPSVRVPDSRVKLYFKKPDKFKPEPLDGDFAVVPKTYNLAVGNLLERMLKDHTVRLLGEEALNGREQCRLKLTPKAKDSPVSYHLLWVDREQATVSQVRTYPAKGPPATVTFTHQRQGRGYLPTSAQMEGTHRAREGQPEEKVQVTIRFTDYKVNIGLADSIFADKDKPKH